MHLLTKQFFISKLLNVGKFIGIIIVVVVFVVVVDKVNVRQILSSVLY